MFTDRNYQIGLKEFDLPFLTLMNTIFIQFKLTYDLKYSADTTALSSPGISFLLTLLFVKKHQEPVNVLPYFLMICILFCLKIFVSV